MSCLRSNRRGNSQGKRLHLSLKHLTFNVHLLWMMPRWLNRQGLIWQRARESNWKISSSGSCIGVSSVCLCCWLTSCCSSTLHNRKWASVSPDNKNHPPQIKTLLKERQLSILTNTVHSVFKWWVCLYILLFCSSSLCIPAAICDEEVIDYKSVEFRLEQ